MEVVLDIETNTKHDKIWLCCTKRLDTGEVQVWHSPTQQFHQLLKQATKLIGHNIVSFDAPVLNRVWGTKITLKKCYDTLLMSRLSNPARNGHSLEDWGKVVGLAKVEYGKIWAWLNDIEYRKDNMDCYNYPHEALLEHYCKGDVEVTALVYKQVQIDLKEFSQCSIDMEHRVQHIIHKQEQNGFMLDVPKLCALKCTLEMEMLQLETTLQQVFQPIVHKRVSEKTGKELQDKIEVFNVGSRKQIAERLISLGWKPKAHTDKGSPIVDESVLEKLPYKEAQLIARYLMLQKRVAQISSWLEKVDEDNRIRGRVITIGAVTNRCTHSSPNLAQVPAVRAPYGLECRSSFIVPDDRVLIGADLSGIELRCLAHYMNDKEWTEELLNGDVHTKNQHAAGLPTRDDAKTFIYAFLYGAGDAKIGSIIGKGAKDGKRLKDNFLKATPSLKRLREKVERLAANGTLPGLDGRLLHVRSEHSALNTLLQGAGAIIAKQWMILCNDNLAKAQIPFKQVAFVHDELEFEVLPEHADLAGKIIVASAEQCGIMLQMRCKVGAEFKVGRSWAAVH